MKRFLTPLALSTALIMSAMVGVVTVANNAVERNIEQAVRHNFAAAGLLSRLQLQAERLRRYEKEMFIYAAVPDKRAKYVKEFDDAYTKLLDLNNRALATQHKGFGAEDRAQLVKWSEATAFYANEFRKTVGTAEAAVTPEQKADLTARLNAEIGPGKDRFRELLDGAAKMREGKEKASLEINDDIDRQFSRLNAIIVAVGACMSIGALFVFARPKRPATNAPARHSTSARAPA